jgi:hypothetical protein
MCRLVVWFVRHQPHKPNNKNIHLQNLTAPIHFNHGLGSYFLNYTCGLSLPVKALAGRTRDLQTHPENGLRNAGAGR